jgi:nitrite reductase/ring-hydroxylating ferredoxin subunit
MSVTVQVASVDEVPVSDMKRVQAADIRALLLNVDGTFYAVQLDCPHQESTLDLGDLDGSTLMCAAHGSEFDVVTGKVLAAPADTDLLVYEVKVRDRGVFIVVPEG